MQAKVEIGVALATILMKLHQINPAERGEIIQQILHEIIRDMNWTPSAYAAGQINSILNDVDIPPNNLNDLAVLFDIYRH